MTIIGLDRGGRRAFTLRTPERAVVGIALLASGCAPSGKAAAFAAAAEQAAVSRVVPQESFDRASYQGTEASGRFAVFDQVVVDLATDRVAWLHDGGVLPALGEVVSVLPSAQGWRILARTGKQQEQPGLVLLSTPPAPAGGVSTLALVLPAARFSLVDPTERYSGPFLSMDPGGELRVDVTETCAACTAPGQLSLWSSVIDPESGRGAAWSETRFDLAQAPALMLPLVGPHAARIATLPAELEAHLARVRTAPDTGTALDVSPDARYALTAAQGRVCVWSLERAERSWCEPRDYQSYRFLDATHVWMSGTRAGAVELALWDLVGRHATKRAFAPGTLTLPGPGDRFLSYVFNPKSRSYALEAWRVASAAPAWTHAGCNAPPYFSAGGTQVVCPEVDMDQPVLLLDAASGAVIAERAARPKADDLPEACELDVAAGVSATISRRDQPVATLFDLSDSDWALVLPDGQFHGSSDALGYLAFFGPDGMPLDRDQLERLRNPSAVQRALSRLRTSLGGCTH